MPPSSDGLTAAMGAVPATEVAGADARSWSLGPMCTMIAAITAPVVALDQISKSYITASLPLYGTRAIIPNWLDLTYTLNPGAAFSLFATMPASVREVLFLVLSFTATIVLLFLLGRRGVSAVSRIGFALILGGTIGNLIDRLFRGRVVDFIYFHHGWFSYPVFNVADSAITIGVAIILIVSFFSSSGPNRSIN